MSQSLADCPRGGADPDTPVKTGRVRRENVKRILKAAERVFAKSGHAGATMGEIAEQADLPKANLHYYFRTKEDLYRAVLDNILHRWLTPLSDLSASDDPATVLTAYVAAKLDASRQSPDASRVFASEMLNGASHISGYLSSDLKAAVDRTADVMEQWIAAGRMAPLDPRQFLFLIWAVTQHYADFLPQVTAVMGRRQLGTDDYSHIQTEVTRLVLRAAGLGDSRK